MQVHWGLVVLWLCWSICGTSAQGLVEVDNQLLNVLATTPSTVSLGAVVTYSAMPTVTDLNTLRSTGVMVKTYVNLPSVGIWGFPSQIRVCYWHWNDFVASPINESVY